MVQMNTVKVGYEKSKEALIFVPLRGGAISTLQGFWNIFVENDSKQPRKESSLALTIVVP